MQTKAVTQREAKCPGCGLMMPCTPSAVYRGYYNCTPECWAVYSEVLGIQFSNAIIFSQVHQMTVDAYAVQHPGGEHPDKSVAIHLAGLHAAFDLGVRQMEIPKLLQRLAGKARSWPHYPPPKPTAPLTVFAIAISKTPQEHVERAEKWARLQWQAWSQYHDAVADLVGSART